MDPGGMRDQISSVCDGIKTMLLAKNEAYGNSALDPIRIFSRASLREQLLVRIDDKLSRITRGRATEAVPEDTVKDLIGYLVLLLVSEAQTADASKDVPVIAASNATGGRTEQHRSSNPCGGLAAAALAGMVDGLGWTSWNIRVERGRKSREHKKAKEK